MILSRGRVADFAVPSVTVRCHLTLAYSELSILCPLVNLLRCVAADRADPRFYGDQRPSLGPSPVTWRPGGTDGPDGVLAARQTLATEAAGSPADCVRIVTLVWTC